MTLYGILCVAQGHGAKGQNEYEFSLEFLSPVKPEVCIHFKTGQRYILFAVCTNQINTCVQVSYKSTQRQVNITVRKQQRGWWERLTVQERKPVFLAPDFDRWLDESDAEMEIREKVSIKAVSLTQWDIFTHNHEWTKDCKMLKLFKYQN